MKYERSAGAIVFRMVRGKPSYLLLHYPSSARTERDYWDFPKGHIEKQEEDQAAAKREITEETGLVDIQFLEGFVETIHYFFFLQGRRISKTVIFFLAETKKKKVCISPEHVGFQWLPFQGALSLLKYKNAKHLLLKANEFLEQNA
ncbi:MAG: NUDIX domain-containing protein [Candidatus Wildermuthbacteria bacterium]|nr:NUDIX domain-containing protein [Candidatus Wildermuthbacteria bacterium]